MSGCDQTLFPVVSSDTFIPVDHPQRQAWRCLEDLPRTLGAVHRWTDIRLPPDPDWDLHAVPTLVCCLAGVVRVRRPLGIQDLGPGDCLVLGPGVWHRHATLRPGAMAWMVGLLPAWADFWIGSDAGRWWGRLPHGPSDRLLHQALHDDPAQRRAAIAALIGLTLSDAEADPGFANEAAQRMVTCLWRGLHQGISVEDLVKASGLQRAQAYAVFTAAYGISPKAALSEGRLSLAAGLLEAGLTVSEAAARSGWPSVDTFSRAWKRRHGVAPSQNR